MTSIGQFGPAARLLVLLTAVLGLAYPLSITGVAQVAFHSQANGSLVTRDGTLVGSTLIGQAYDDPSYFQSRPSAAGDGYDPLATSASNLGLDNPELVKLVRQRRAAAARGSTPRSRRSTPRSRLRVWPVSGDSPRRG
jgi:K+-transporting ATPase ATPase C chain